MRGGHGQKAPLFFHLGGCKQSTIEKWCNSRLSTFFVNTAADLGFFGYNPRTATGVDYVVIKAHIRNGEAGGGMLDCIFRVLLAVSHGASTVVVSAATAYTN